MEAPSPNRSPPHRPVYFVQSPSQHDVEKMSYWSSPFGSPPHYYCSPIHHSRESSTSRFSTSLKSGRNSSDAWKMIERKDDDEEREGGALVRFYVIYFVVSFVVLFIIFSLILWAASVLYKPKIFVKSMVFENFNVQSGMATRGLPTDMLTLNSTVKTFSRIWRLSSVFMSLPLRLIFTILISSLPFAI